MTIYGSDHARLPGLLGYVKGCVPELHRTGAERELYGKRAAWYGDAHAACYPISLWYCCRRWTIPDIVRGAAPQYGFQFLGESARYDTGTVPFF